MAENGNPSVPPGGGTPMGQVGQSAVANGGVLFSTIGEIHGAVCLTASLDVREESRRKRWVTRQRRMCTTASRYLEQ